VQNHANGSHIPAFRILKVEVFKGGCQCHNKSQIRIEAFAWSVETIDPVRPEIERDSLGHVDMMSCAICGMRLGQSIQIRWI
jgi:hypothetical protein